jgi:alpha-L-rhamnosidase
VAGVRQQPGSVGWKKILIAPDPGPLTHAEATFNSPAGRIRSSWTVKDGKFHLGAEVPAGVEAQLVAPDGAKKDVGPGTHTLECSYRPAAR